MASDFAFVAGHRR